MKLEVSKKEALEEFKSAKIALLKSSWKPGQDCPEWRRFCEAKTKCRMCGVII